MEETKQMVDQVNSKAEVIWNHRDTFRRRFRGCYQITLPAVKFVFPSPPSSYKGIKPSTWEELDEIFIKHYRDCWLSIGQADDDAYEIQDRYMCDVADVLGLECKYFGSRAIVLLGKVYGRTAVPLLTKGSIEAMWKVCSSSFYKRQLFLVSSLLAYWRLPF